MTRQARHFRPDSGLAFPLCHPSRRRILFVITDLQIGGMPRVLRDVVFRLRLESPARIEVACLAAWGPVADELKAGGINVTALNGSPRDLTVVWRLARHIARGRFDTVMSFLVHANLASGLASLLCPNVRFIQSIHTTQPQPRWHWIAQGLVHRLAEAVVVPSFSVADALRTRSHLPASRLVHIPNAVEIEGFPASLLASQDPRPFPVGFIGRFDPIKRIEDFLAAGSILGPGVHLHLFGDGAERSRVEESLLADPALAARTTVHGQVASPQIAHRQIGLLVLCSDAEGLPMVVIEAMAAGIAVVATDVPGIRDVVAHEKTGLLVPPRSPAQLAKAIERLITDVVLRRKLTNNARASISEKYSWPTVLAGYRRVLGL